MQRDRESLLFFSIKKKKSGGSTRRVPKPLLQLRKYKNYQGDKTQLIEYGHEKGRERKLISVLL